MYVVFAVAEESKPVQKLPLYNLKGPPNERVPLIPAPPKATIEPVVTDVDAVDDESDISLAPIELVDGIVKFLLIAIDIY